MDTFSVSIGSSPKTTSLWRKMNKGETSSAEAENFAEHFKNLHEEVKKHIKKMNSHYKAKANRKRRYKEFHVGD